MRWWPIWFFFSSKATGGGETILLFLHKSKARSGQRNWHYSHSQENNVFFFTLSLTFRCQCHFRAKFKCMQRLPYWLVHSEAKYLPDYGNQDAIILPRIGYLYTSKVTRITLHSWLYIHTLMDIFQNTETIFNENKWTYQFFVKLVLLP